MLTRNGETQVAIYPKNGHEPAEFTVLNFPVADIEEAEERLAEKGIRLGQYEGEIETAERVFPDKIAVSRFPIPAGVKMQRRDDCLEQLKVKEKNDDQ